MASVKLEQKVEEFRKKNDEFEAQMAPRIMEISRPAERLKQFPGTKVSIISALGGDCTATASQISEMLRMAKWDVEGIIVTPKPMLDGIMIGICSTNEHWTEAWGIVGVGKPDFEFLFSNRKAPSKEASIALVDELNNSGIDAKRDETINLNTSLRFNGVLIFVGPKPTILESQLFKAEIREKKLLEKMETNFFDDKIGEEYWTSSEKRSKLMREQIQTIIGTNRGGRFIMGGGNLP